MAACIESIEGDRLGQPEYLAFNILEEEAQHFLNLARRIDMLMLH
jgi:hypothetical protein